MEFYEAVSRRHMVREWKEEDIPRETLEKILAAGLQAPTHDHQRNWEFIVLHSREEKENALQFAKVWSVSQEENKAVSVLGVPEGYLIPCYIGIGRPAEDAHVVEQVKKPLSSTLHFGKWYSHCLKSLPAGPPCAVLHRRFPGQPSAGAK